MKNILGYRDYSTQRKIRETIKTSINYEGENIESAELLCLFDTSKQRTWMIATQKRIYLVLDDVRKEYLKVNKSFRINTLYSNGRIHVRIDPKYRSLAGVIYFQNASRGWLYSKNLFPDTKDLHYAIERIIQRLI